MACSKRLEGAAVQAPRRMRLTAAARRGAGAAAREPSLSRRQASRRAQAQRSLWARPGAACQWARPAQLRVNLAPQLALPAAAGMRAPLLGSATAPRPGAWPGAYSPGASPGQTCTI
jgi:hypothetical protein